MAAPIKNLPDRGPKGSGSRNARKHTAHSTLEVGAPRAGESSPGTLPGAIVARQCKEGGHSSGKSKKNPDKLLQCLNAFMRTVISCGIRGDFHLDTRTVDHWRKLVVDVNGQWMKVAKYKRDAFIAYHYGTEPVESPFSEAIKDCPGRLFNGPLHTALDSVCRRRARGDKTQERFEFLEQRRHQMLLGLTSVKLICPRPDESTQRDSSRATVVALTTECKDLENLVLDAEEFPTWAPLPVADRGVKEQDNEEKCEEDEEIKPMITRELMGETIRSVLREVVSKKAWRNGRCMVDTFFPPTRANYDYSVAKGGGVAGLCSDPEVNLDEKKEPGGMLPEITSEKVFSPSKDDVDGILRCYGYDDQDTKKLGAVWADILSQLRATDSVQRLKPIALAEPLKVRVITKGSWKVFMALRNLQQFLAKQLKKHPSFLLTGTPVTVEIVSTLGTLRDGEAFLNGDYTAATNNIKSWISAIYVEELCAHLGLSEQLSMLLLDGMVNNLIEDHNGILHQQTSGQPMGFNNSFVGLCVCNAALAKVVRAYDEGRPLDAPRMKLSEGRILVNGDDLVMPVSKYGYSFWKKLGAFVGLSPSIGKTYYTRDFAQINSRNFLYYDDLVPETGERVGRYLTVYGLNMGLLEGSAKKGRHTSEMPLPSALSQLANNYRQLMADAPSLEEKKRVHGIFVRLHREKLEQAQVPWYVPCWAGGLGLTGLILPNERERRGMHYIRMNMEECKPKSLPVSEDATGKEPNKEWFVHQLAAEFLPSPDHTFSCDHPGIRVYEQAVGKKSLDMLLDSKVDMQKLFHASTIEDRALSNLKHNRRLWRSLFRRASLPAPLSLFESLERVVYECFPVTIEHCDCDGLVWSEEPYVPMPPLVCACCAAGVPLGFLVRNDEC
jgi:hypothetical protein